MDTILGYLIAAGATLVAFLVLVMLFYEQILVVLAWLLHALFAIGCIAAVSSLVWPSPFRCSAQALIERSGVPAQIRQVDRWVDSIRSLPSDLMDRLQHPFSSGPDETGVPQMRAPAPPGGLETRVVDTLVDGLTALLRLLGFVLGVLLMVVGLAFRSTSDLVLQVRALRSRIERLERRPGLPSV